MRSRRLMTARVPTLASCLVGLLGAVLALLAPAAAASSCHTERSALVIGEAAYPDSDAPLGEPLSNARAMADALKTLGFATTEAEDLTRDGMQAALDAFDGKIGRDSVVALFFSGIAIAAGGHTYLVPVDARIWSEADVKTYGFSLDRILSDLAARGAAGRIVVVDGARRNPFERRFRTSGSTGLAPVTAAPGLLALYSTAPGLVFSELGSGVSPFVADLVRELSEPGAKAEAAFRRTQRAVSHMSRPGQTPFVSSFLDADVALDGSDCARPAATVATLPSQAALPPRAEAAVKPTTAEPAPTPTASPEASPPPPRTQEALAVAPAPAASPVPRDDDPIVDPVRLAEIDDRLFEQNLDPGEPGSAKTLQAIRTFEDRAGLPATARPTLTLLRALRDAPTLAPWGAIVFSPSARRFGMIWNAPSRRTALADAQAKCGAGSCSAFKTFGNTRCGAFARSERYWGMGTGAGVGAARDEAIDTCQKGGTVCRVVGAVCADGSNRNP